MSQPVKFVNVPGPLAQLAERCLVINSNKRISFAELCCEWRAIVENQKAILSSYAGIGQNVGQIAENVASSDPRLGDFNLD